MFKNTHVLYEYIIRISMLLLNTVHSFIVSKVGKPMGKPTLH